MSSVDAAAARRRSISTTSAPTSPKCSERHALGLDAARPDAVARRRKTGQRTARENIDDLCDPGTFVEYGAAGDRGAAAAPHDRGPDRAHAGRRPGRRHRPRQRRPVRRRRTRSCIVMSYDYTVLAGTQGQQNHRKKDRMFELAEQLAAAGGVLHRRRRRAPGRHRRRSASPASTVMAFQLLRASSAAWCRWSASTPAAASPATRRCSAAATSSSRPRDSNIGMGGPAMIEGGGLGVFRPEEVGPIDVQVPNGVVDIAVADEAEAVRVAKQVPLLFPGPARASGSAPTSALLRGIIPENRLRIYDVRAVIETLADTGSVLELRRHFGLGMVTALVRIEGRPLGVDRQQPDPPRRRDRQRRRRQGRALHAAVRRVRHPAAVPVRHAGHHGRPGGREDRAGAPRRADVRRSAPTSRVPFFTIVLRKGYGLGAQAMAGGSFKAPTVHRRVADRRVRRHGPRRRGEARLSQGAGGDRRSRRSASQLFDEMVARMYEHGKALNTRLALRDR